MIEEDIETMLICDGCGEEICLGEEAINIFKGRSGFGPKSGQPMVVESGYSDYENANLHTYCVAKFAREKIYEQQLDDSLTCAGCDAKLG